MANSALQKIETLFDANEKQEALKEYKSFMENAGDHYDLWVNYAVFLFRCGQFEEAAAMAEKSISIKPSPEGYHNLASAQKELGKIKESIEHYKKAIHYNPDFVQSHNDLGSVYELNRQHALAIDHFQTAATLSPDNSIIWINLARSRLSEGRLRESLSALRTARKLDEDNDLLWTTYGNLFKVLNDYDVNRTLVDEITTCLYKPQVNPDFLTQITQAFFHHQVVVKKLLAEIDDYRIQNFETLMQDNTLNWGVFSHAVFIGALTRVMFWDARIENLLTTMRFHLLQIIVEKKEHLALVEKFIPFTAALSCQSFLKEYVFFESGEEKTLIGHLQNKIETDPENITALEISIYACYRPLFNLATSSQILKKFADQDALKTMLSMQISEPLEEQEIKKTLKTLTRIDDEISTLVKAQYEANPYPRWLKASPGTAHPLDQALKYLFPHLKNHDFSAINTTNPKTLVAGCGTGKHVIDLTFHHANTDILAIDLSASSLAYATRKTKEYGLDNVEYGIADILRLPELGQKFDIVHCGGVLHHMHDPMAGWSAINECLKPGGFMMIGLYSERARKAVALARKFIAERGYKSDVDGIRALREELKMLPDHHPLKIITTWRDYSSTSECRDLIFHVQEHRFTPLQLKKCIADLGLEFLGFQLIDKRVLTHYAEIFPEDPHGLNLSNWDDYEHQNPETFRAMYQFWLYKPLS